MPKNETIKQRNLCALFAALIAIGSFLRIPVFTVPYTMQTLFVLLSSLLLGGKWGSVSVAVYLAVGLCGLPVFSKGGGLGYVAEPTFGYLLGFLGAAFVTGTLSGKRKPQTAFFFLCGCIGLFITYCFGSLYFYFVQSLHFGITLSFKTLLFSSVLAFLPWDLLCCFLASFIGVKVLQFDEKLKNQR